MERLVFPDSYFDDEIREGFYVSGEMKRAWAAQLEVLDALDKVCKKHGISWFMDYGTLLGAVRHKGFVPWDDDMDICMLREDFERLLLVRDELPDGYVLLNPRTREDYATPLSRIVNTEIIRLDEPFLKKYHNFPFAGGMDIFIFDRIPDDDTERKMWVMEAEAVRTLAEVYVQQAEDMQREPSVVRSLKKVQKMYGIRLDPDKDIGVQLYRVLESVYSRYMNKKTETVGLVPTWIAFNRTCRRYKREWFDETVYLPFENTCLPAPVGYLHLLKDHYGENYMCYNRNGMAHSYPFYRAMENQLSEQNGWNSLFYYQYDKARAFHRDQTKVSCKKQVKQILSLMDRCHQLLYNSLKLGETEAMPDTLRACQELALKAGNMIEAKLGEKHELIRQYENYCEAVFRSFDVIQTDRFEYEELEKERQALLQIFTGIKENTEKQFLRPKTAVFILTDGVRWKGVESLWKAVREDPDWDPVVVPVPVYRRNCDGSLREGELRIEGIPEEIPKVSYTAIDLEALHPDIIFINDCCDQYNHTSIIAPDFFSGILAAKTECLIYIPWFRLEEIGENEPIPMQSTEYFVRKPGVINADFTVVQSAAMRKVYLKVLEEMTGEREIWEGRILDLGLPLDYYSENGCDQTGAYPGWSLLKEKL